MRSFIYVFPSWYERLLNVFHGKKRDERFRKIAGCVKGKSVLDLACGTGEFCDYVPQNVEYTGYDLNPKFVSYGCRKGRNLLMYDVANGSYPRKADTVTFIDCLHHMGHSKENLMENAIEAARKRVIVCEPYDIPGRRADHFLHVLLDSDGVNPHGEWMDKLELFKFLKSYGSETVPDGGNYLLGIIDV